MKLVREENIVLKMKCHSDVDALTKLSNLLIKNKVVEESFQTAVLEREKIYPTGLETESIGVALPHTDAEHVNLNTLAVATLENPVEFSMMGFPEKKVSVNIIIMLAISEPNGHLEILSKLSDLLQNPEMLKKIKSSSKKEFVSNSLNDIFL